mgnify:CR=1 FL=1
MRAEKYAVALIMFGMILILAGFIVLFIESLSVGVQTSGAAVIFIGPIPIAYAWGEAGIPLLIVSLLMILLIIIISYLMSRTAFKVLQDIP